MGARVDCLDGYQFVAAVDVSVEGWFVSHVSVKWLPCGCHVDITWLPRGCHLVRTGFSQEDAGIKEINNGCTGLAERWKHSIDYKSNASGVTQASESRPIVA